MSKLRLQPHGLSFEFSCVFQLLQFLQAIVIFRFFSIVIAARYHAPLTRTTKSSPLVSSPVSFHFTTILSLKSVLSTLHHIKMIANHSYCPLDN